MKAVISLCLLSLLTQGYSQQAGNQSILDYCATSVTRLSDLLDRPECCDQEDTAAEYGGCCLELAKGKGCYEKPYVPNLQYCPNRVRSIHMLDKYPICCMHQ